jgi:hypothetical protein
MKRSSAVEMIAVPGRGLTWYGPDKTASELVRPIAEDMFR